MTRTKEEALAMIEVRAAHGPRTRRLLLARQSPSPCKTSCPARAVRAPLRTGAQAFHGQLVRGEVDFATLASRESHCSSAKRGGDLGEFG